MPSNDKASGSTDDTATARPTSASVRGAGNDVKRSRRRAVVVGINDYPGEVNDLPSCVNDANAFIEMLRKDYAFDDIARLVDTEATVANVTAALKRLFADASPEDRLVFYHSGHGSTETRNGIVEECLVLHDGYLFDDTLSQLTQDLPPGILTVVLDSCFSGGLEKQLLMPVIAALGFVSERAQVKAYTRPSHKEFVEHTDQQDRTRAIKRFGESIVARPPSVIGNVLDPLLGIKSLGSAPASDEVRQVQMKGVLLAACLETETAAASTRATDGKSAFTFALLRSLNKLGVGTSIGALVEATQSMVKSIGLTQTPLLKEPQVPPGMRSRSFITMGSGKDSGDMGAATDPVSALLDLLKHSSLGARVMDVSALIQLLLRAANNDYQPPEQSKLFGIDDAILVPAIASVITAAIKGQQTGVADKSPLGDALRLAGGLIKDYRPPERQKLFGIDDAILIPAIVSVVTAAIKGQQAPEQKLFGIDDAILVPAVVSVVTAAIKGQQSGGADKSLLGDVIRIAGGLVKGQQAPGQKLFGIDDAILVPAVASLITAAIKGQQTAGAGKSALGDAIRIAGGLIKGQQAEQKLFGIDDAILVPVVTSAVTAAMNRH